MVKIEINKTFYTQISFNSLISLYARKKNSRYKWLIHNCIFEFFV